MPSARKAPLLVTLVKDMLDRILLFNEADYPFSYHLKPAAASKLLLVTGDNCSGKSLFVSILQAWGREHFQTQPINVSIVERTGAGSYESSGLRRTMMFGDESEQSTGATSFGVVKRAFHNVNTYAEDGKRPILLLDEPDFGLSEGYAAALGAYIAQQTHVLHADVAGVVVVSHSRPLAQALAAGKCAPSFLHTQKPMTLKAWLKTPEVRTVEELATLSARQQECRVAISRLMSQIRQMK